MPTSSIHISDNTSKHEADRHGDGNEDIFEVQSVDELYNLFSSFMTQRATFEYMDFHAHGSPGRVEFARGSLTRDQLARFRNKGFHKLFKPNAEIRFYSCECAKGSDGERFLAEFASIFLQGNGGTAKGSDNCLIVRAYQEYFSTNGAPKNTGDWIIADVPANNTQVTLRNQNWLHADRIRLSIYTLKNILIPMKANGGGSRCSPAPSVQSRGPMDDLVNSIYQKQQEDKEFKAALADSLDQKLDHAAALVKASQPSIQALYDALDDVNQVARVLKKGGITEVDTNPYITYEQ